MVGLAGVTVDITEKKLLEQELRSSRNIMEQAMAEMSDGLAMFGPDGRIVFCNERYRVLFPKSAYARIEGAHITEIVRAAVRNGERQDLPIDVDEDSIQAAGQRLFVNKDEVIPLTDGRWLSLRTRVTEDHHVLALVSDITAMKESELSLKSFAEQMKGLAETDALTGLAILDKLVENYVAHGNQLIAMQTLAAFILVEISSGKPDPNNICLRLVLD